MCVHYQKQFKLQSVGYSLFELHNQANKVVLRKYKYIFYALNNQLSFS